MQIHNCMSNLKKKLYFNAKVYDNFSTAEERTYLCLELTRGECIE